MVDVSHVEFACCGMMKKGRRKEKTKCGRWAVGGFILGRSPCQRLQRSSVKSEKILRFAAVRWQTRAAGEVNHS